MGGCHPWRIVCAWSSATVKPFCWAALREWQSLRSPLRWGLLGAAEGISRLHCRWCGSSLHAHCRWDEQPVPPCFCRGLHVEWRRVAVAVRSWGGGGVVGRAAPVVGLLGRCGLVRGTVARSRRYPAARGGTAEQATLLRLPL